MEKKPKARDLGTSKTESRGRQDEDELFRRAMDGVVPLPGGASGKRARGRGADSDRPATGSEGVGQRADPEGTGPTGARAAPRRGLMRKLRRGGFRVEEDLDLHGLNRIEARRELDLFLRECVARGLRCVRIVHGRGWNSPNRESVLRTKATEWLAESKLVQAFAPALPRDGGPGALYVLLRRETTKAKGRGGSTGGGRD